MKAEDVEVFVPPDFTPPRRGAWVTPLFVGLASFGLASLSITSAARRQTPILDSMELQPFASAAALAYAWGSRADAIALERRVLALAERRKGEPKRPPSGHEPDFDTLRRMDADMARLRLAVLEDAPYATFAELCTHATIRCTPYKLDGLIGMLKKERHAP